MRVGFRDTQQRTGGACVAAVVVFPGLEGARADADERGKPRLPSFVATRQKFRFPAADLMC